MHKSPATLYTKPYQQSHNLVPSSAKHQPVSLFNSSTHNARLSQLDLFSFYDSFDESRTVYLGGKTCFFMAFNAIWGKFWIIISVLFPRVSFRLCFSLSWRKKINGHLINLWFQSAVLPPICCSRPFCILPLPTNHPGPVSQASKNLKFDWIIFFGLISFILNPPPPCLCHQSEAGSAWWVATTSKTGIEKICGRVVEWQRSSCACSNVPWSRPFSCSPTLSLEALWSGPWQRYPSPLQEQQELPL